MDPVIGRKTWRTLEPIHAAIYFVPESDEEYAALGVQGRMSGYFPSRAAAMGSVGTDVVKATFFNFDPGFVEKRMAGAWNLAPAEEWVAARFRAADRMLRRIAGDQLAVLEAAAPMLREAALVACARPEGRPLFAGNADQAWPDEPHLIAWQAQTLLREYRGDGHIAALTAQGLNGCEALVTHAAVGEIGADVLKNSRRRSDDDWAAAIESLQSRGWLDGDGALTELGRRERQWIEDRTDELANAPYAAIGEDACAELRSSCRDVSAALAGAIGF